MRAAPLRFLMAALWAADDYVERTSPIVGSAIAFWVCAIALVVLANPAVVSIGGAFGDEAETALTLVRRVPSAFVGVLWWFTPVLYATGFWLFTARDERFPR